jgi:exodeoxyribonuclease VII large subunit
VSDRMGAVVRTRMARSTSAMEGLAGRLDAMSPLKVLARGYAIATRQDGRAVRASQDVSPGDRIAVRVKSAVIDADVIAVRDENEPK